jgi:hypothetical protein
MADRIDEWLSGDRQSIDRQFRSAIGTRPSAISQPLAIARHRSVW